IQGLGAGGLMALPLAIMGDILAPRERAKYQGYFLAVFGISSIIGPLIGGLFASTPEILFVTGWRWVFLINLPVGIAALAIVLRFLHIPHTRRAVRIDWWGAATVVIALVPLLLVAEKGREWGWDSIPAILSYVIGALGIAAFIISEKLMGDDALIPLKLFKHPTFAMTTVLGVLVGFGMFGAMMTIPLYLQLVNGATPTESGFLMLPMILGLMIASITSGQIIARTGTYAIFPKIGTAFMALGFFWLTFLTADRPLIWIMTGMFLIGLGLGQLMQTLTIAAQNSVGPRDIGVATSSSTFFRQIGGTLGVAVLFSVLFTRIPETIAAAFQTKSVTDGIAAAVADPTVLADPANTQILQLFQQAQNGGSIGNALDGDTSFLNGSDPRLAAPFLEGFNNATVSIYWVGLVIVLIAFVLSFFLKAAPLREKSALQENADADAARMAQSAAELTGSMVSPDAAQTGSNSVVPDVESTPKPTKRS
ncbi:MAG: MFS transporter, partial [Rhodoglobus sp.]